LHRKRSEGADFVWERRDLKVSGNVLWKVRMKPVSEFLVVRAVIGKRVFAYSFHVSVVAFKG